jgi:DNA-binding protein H-NS
MILGFESRRMIKDLNIDLESIPINELWEIHEEISRVLSVRLTSEKHQLEKRLARLRRDSNEARPHAAKNSPLGRRKYPRVVPKYQNPDEPSETWSGRGKRPRWLAAALKIGHRIEEFAIKSPQNGQEGTKSR